MKLEKIANVAVLLTCLFVGVRLGVDIYHVIVPRQSASRYKAGLKLADSPDLQFVKARKTLVMMTSSHCHYCTASMEFYRRLTLAARAAQTRIVATSMEEPAINREYLQSNGVRPDVVLSSSTVNLPVESTPTLLLVSADGRVTHSWIGQLPASKEREVISAVEDSH